MNFELIDNSFQIIILGFCTIAALFLALRYKSRSLLILALAYACFCMGTAYYILYLVIMGKVPQVFYVAEISWLAAWLFYLSVQILRMEKIGYRFSWFAGSAAVLVAVVAFADHAFGPSYFFSTLFALTAGANMYLSVLGMQSVHPYRSTDGLMAGCIVLQVLLYLVSDFIQDYTCFNLYFAVDITLTLSMVALLPFTLREVGK